MLCVLSFNMYNIIAIYVVNKAQCVLLIMQILFNIVFRHFTSSAYQSLCSNSKCFAIFANLVCLTVS